MFGNPYLPKFWRKQRMLITFLRNTTTILQTQLLTVGPLFLENYHGVPLSLAHSTYPSLQDPSQNPWKIFLLNTFNWSISLCLVGLLFHSHTDPLVISLHLEK